MDFSENEIEFTTQNHTIIQDTLKDRVVTRLPADNPIIENPQNFNSEMPHVLDFLPEISVSADSFFPCEDFNNCGQNSIFFSSENSINLNTESFTQQPTLMTEENASVSECFSRNRQLVCEDSMDATSREAASSSLVFTSCHLEEEDDDDFFLAAAEDTSMDSGLGSVESAYANSEEESTPSPCLEQCALDRGEDKNTGEDGTLLVSTEEFHDCTSESNLMVKRPQLMKKREYEPDGDQLEAGAPVNKVQKVEKRVSFHDVTVFYFPRKQSFVTVPSQGGSTLGMGMEHTDCSVMTLQEHKHEMKLRHRELVKEHLQEQKLENKIKQLKYLNPSLDNGTLSSMAKRAIGQSDLQQSSTSDDSFLDNFDEFFFLQPITAKKRRKILRSAGIERIDGEEKMMNRILRESRESCGCTCEQVCEPDTCECVLSGIQCQVDRESFPCGCLANGCSNENGRIEFDSDRVRAHLLSTMEKLRQVQQGSQVDFFIGTEDTDPAANSESECDFASSDDAEQSDGDTPFIARHLTFADEDDDIGNETALTQKTDDQEERANLQVADHASNLQFSDEIIHFGEKEIFERPPIEYLNALELQKVEIDFFNENSTLINQYGIDSKVSISDTENPTPHFLFHCNNNVSMCPQLDHKALESSAQTVQDKLSYNRSMYGTTSSRQNSPGQLLSRDCSVSLDPIATFMSNTYTVATADTSSRGDGC